MHAKVGNFRDARVAELNCQEHFKINKNYELFVNPGNLATFKHVGKNPEVIYFLGDDLAKEKAEASEEHLRKLLDYGISDSLYQDLLIAFQQGYAYAMLYSD